MYDEAKVGDVCQRANGNEAYDFSLARRQQQHLSGAEKGLLRSHHRRDFHHSAGWAGTLSTLLTFAYLEIDGRSYGHIHTRQ